MKTNLKSFPTNYEQKSKNISEEIKEILDRELGKDTYASFMQIINSPDIGKTEDKKAQVVSFTFTFSPENTEDENTQVLIGLLIQAIVKDEAISSAVYDRYSKKLGQALAAMLQDSDDDDEEGDD